MTRRSRGSWRAASRPRGRPNRADPAGEGPAVDGPGRWRGTPRGASRDATAPAEGTRVDPTLASLPRKRRPSRLIVDRGDDSHGLRRSLKAARESAQQSRPVDPPARPIRTAAVAAGLGVAGGSSGRSAGWAPSAGSPVATIGCWPPTGLLSLRLCPPGPAAGCQMSSKVVPQFGGSMAQTRKET
jgi:hypothetical protein